MIRDPFQQSKEPVTIFMAAEIEYPKYSQF